MPPEQVKTRAGERAAGNQAIRRSRKVLSYVRAMMWVSVVVYGIGALVVWGQPGLRGALYAGTAALGLIGALTIYRFPVHWTATFAVIQTVTTVATLSSGSIPQIQIGWSAVFWIAVVHVRTAAKYLDSVDPERRAERLAGRLSTDAAESSARVRQRSKSRADSRTVQLRLILISVGILCAVVLGAIGVKTMSQPAPIEGERLKWEQALEAGDVPGARALCTELYQKRWPKVEKVLARENWLDGVELGEARELSSTDAAKVFEQPLPRGTLKTRWEVEGGAWRVARVVFSGVRER